MQRQQSLVPGVFWRYVIGLVTVNKLIWFLDHILTTQLTFTDHIPTSRKLLLLLLTLTDHSV